jgi:predicted permease
VNRLFGFWTRLRRTLNRRAFEQQMAEEMRAHLELETTRRVANGEPEEVARRQAAREFGSIDSWQERVRDRRLGSWVDELAPNLRFAWRGLRKSPAFTFIAIATIAIGIGAGTAVFSLVNAILLRSLPVPNPQALRVVHWSATDLRMRSYTGDYMATVGDRQVRESVNYPIFLRLREAVADAADLFGYFPIENATIVTARSAFSGNGLMVSDNFFSGLGVSVVQGRAFHPAADAAGATNIIISHDLWQRHFGGAADALGQTVAMRGTEFTIIGILPPFFVGIRPGATCDFYVPLSEGSPLLYVPLTDDWHWFIRMMARLNPGASDTQVQAVLSTNFSTVDVNRVKGGRIELVAGHGGLGFDRDLYGKPLTIMLGVTALVMLIACANLAGLSLSRGAAREHELAVRAALGAGRRRLVAQALTESTVLAALGGAAGIILALWGRQGLLHLLAGSPEGLHYDLSVDLRVLCFSLVAALVTAILAGLPSAFRASRIDPLDGLKARGAAGVPRLRMSRLLVAVQICISLSVLTGAVLGLRSLQNLRHVSAGFDTDNLIIFKLNPSSAGYDNRGLVDFHRRTQAAIASIPGVNAATVMGYAHLSDHRSSGTFRFPDDDLPPEEERTTRRQTASDTFFPTLGIPLLEGRGIEASDTIDTPKVVVVNEAFARELSPGRSPIGRTFHVWGADWRIVGVTGDVKMAHLKEEVPPTTYFPLAQRFYDRFSLGEVAYAVRSPLPATALRRPIEQAIRAIHPEVPIVDFSTQNALLNRNIGQERLLATLCGALAGMTLLLCSIGLYGLIAYDVTRRRGEIAIRIAIGAQRKHIASPILGQALLLVALGVGAGLPIAYGIARLLESQLYQVQPNDPLLLIGVVAFLGLVALLAVLIPAARASRTDPLQALRSD